MNESFELGGVVVVTSEGALFHMIWSPTPGVPNFRRSSAALLMMLQSTSVYVAFHAPAVILVPLLYPGEYESTDDCAPRTTVYGSATAAAAARTARSAHLNIVSVFLPEWRLSVRE